MLWIPRFSEMMREYVERNVVRVDDIEPGEFKPVYDDPAAPNPSNGTPANFVVGLSRPVGALCKSRRPPESSLQNQVRGARPVVIPVASLLLLPRRDRRARL